MKMKHLLLEAYCNCEDNDTSTCCIDGKNQIDIHCFDDGKCEFLSYTYCPNELAYAGKEGVVVDENSFTGFGGEMDADLDSIDYDSEREDNIKMWEKICIQKIAEAYDEYISKKCF